ncbi:MAG: CDP-diacylglycerol---glycerol-3-phosphate 3-phosphatidyltransferase [Actinomycetota bacterium]|nr:CDP-diacylglycerol---glycerol-3-phosphate 3-phosphatidyltransferase [Actinomycetota bacterium]
MIAEVGPARVSPWNIANALTALRLVLVPVFAQFLLIDGGENSRWRVAAACTFCVAVATDRLDGELARRRGLITDIGKIADPIADKALIGTALVGLSLLGELSWWVTAVVLVREIGITVMRFLVIRHRVMPAGRGGKAKTALQALAVVLYLVGTSGTAHTTAVAVMALAVAVTLLTGVDYVLQAVRLVTAEEHVPADELLPADEHPEPRGGPTGGLGRIGPDDLVVRVLEGLGGSGATLAVAESLTGGQVLARLICVPGASAVLRGGVVAYATDLKHQLLGVDRDLLAREGAVHPQVAVRMAQGVRERLGATWGVATTGVAGPDPADGRPPGTVHVAVAGPDTLEVRSLALPGDRGAVREAAADAALGLLGDCLGPPAPPPADTGRPNGPS